MGYPPNFSHSDLALLEQLALFEARKSFWAFRCYMRPKMKRGWWQKDFADHLQQWYHDLICGKSPMLFIQAPPQHGKSETVNDFLAWLIGKHPELMVIFASYSERLGQRANKSFQRYQQHDRYKRVFPKDLYLAGGALRDDLIELAGGGYFRNTTVRGPVTGESLDVGVIDDPIKNREEASSVTIREKTWDWFTDDFLTRFSETAGFLGIMTRWNLDDLFGRAQVVFPNAKVRTYRAIAEEDELPFRKEGEALFPEHKSLEFLKVRKDAMLAHNWNALYQQRPIAKEGNLFQREWFEVIPEAPLNATWVRGWDLASTKDPKAAFTAGVLLGRLPDGRFVIADSTRIQGTPAEVERLLINTAAQDKARFGGKVRGSLPKDPGQAGVMQSQYLIRQLAGYNYSASPESGDKAERAYPFAAQSQAGNVALVSGAWNKPFLDELVTFPEGKWKDQVDATSRAFGVLTMGSNYDIMGLAS